MLLSLPKDDGMKSSENVENMYFFNLPARLPQMDLKKSVDSVVSSVWCHLVLRFPEWKFRKIEFFQVKM